MDRKSERGMIVKRRSLAAFMVVGPFGGLLFGASCSTTPAANTSDWQTALHSIQGEGRAIYSFRFTGAPPDGAFFQALLVGEGLSGLACAPDTDPSSADYWTLDVELGGTAEGVYDITSDDVVGTRGTKANVSLLHRQNGAYTGDYPAVTGAVTLAATASLDAAAEGRSIAIAIDAQFPSRAMDRLACQGGAPILTDGAIGPVTTSCTCRDPSGALTTCIPDDGGKGNCCINTTSTTVPFTTHVSAESCPSLCRVAVGLADFCAAVQP
jgi:hypothetical protein